MAKVKVATLLKKIFNDAGIKDTDARLIDALTITAEIEDSLVTELESVPLISVENAKNHAGLQAHFNAKIFNGMDAKIAALAADGDLSDTDIAEIAAEKNSYQKLALLKDKIKTSIAAKHVTPADKAVLVKEVEKLNADIVAKDNSAKAEIAKAKQEAEDMVTDYAYDSLLATQKYANKELDINVNVLTAKTLVNQELAAKKAKLVRIGKDFKLINAENPDLEFLENNKPVNFSDLVTSTLANKKLLEISGGQGPAPTRKTVVTPEGGKGANNSKLIAAYDADIAAVSAL